MFAQHLQCSAECRASSKSNSKRKICTPKKFVTRDGTWQCRPQCSTSVVHIVYLVKQIHQINVWHVLNDKLDLNCTLRARVLTAKEGGHHHGSMGLDSSLSLYAAIAASWRVQQQSAKFKTSTRRELKSSAHETLRCRAMWAMTMLSVHKQRLDNTRSLIGDKGKNQLIKISHVLNPLY